MPVVTEHRKWRKHRKRFSHSIQETDPNPQISSIIQSTRCKSTISSLLLSTFSNNTTSNETTHASGQNRKNNNTKKKNNSNFSEATFRGLGCTAGASQQVSVPAVIRSSADWQGKKNRKKKHRRNSDKNSNNSSKRNHGVVVDGSGTCVDFQDVWCGPGIGFSADAAAAASADCVVARKNVSARVKLDVEKITHREVL